MGDLQVYGILFLSLIPGILAFNLGKELAK